MTNKVYTQEQLDIELLKQRSDDFQRSLERIEGTQRWILGLMGSGFVGLLGLMAHGFKWLQ